MVLAEKIVTAIDRGETNTRWRDYADIYAIVGQHEVAAIEFAKSLKVVAQYRHVDVEPLLPRLEHMPHIAQAKWTVWRKRVRREGDLPELFGEVLGNASIFADPVVEGTAHGKAWMALRQAWV